MSEKKDRIVQLISADGWHALYWKQSEPFFQLRRLIAFALIEKEDGSRQIIGVDEDQHLCGWKEDFGEYRHSSAIDESYLLNSRARGENLARAA